MKSFLLISILITAIIFGGLSFNQASAHQDPVTCFVNNPSLGLSVLRDTAPAGAGPEDVTPVITSGNGKAAIGEQVIYKVVMKKTNTSDDCNFQDGTLKIKMPNGVVIVLSSGLPLITGTAEPTGTFTNRTAYVVVAANDNFSCAAGVDGNPDGLLTACAFYGLNPNVSGAVQGIAHTGPGSSESPASAFSSIPMAFTVPYTPSTDSSSKSKTLPAPIVNPTDKVTVQGLAGISGTFNGNYTLIDSTGTPHSGTCASDTVNATGFATLTCSATGTFGVTTDNTCWDVTVTAPSPYTPTKTLLLGSNDANDECFRVVTPPWSASTLSNYHGEQTAPVVNPTDTITVNADASIGGTFTATFDIYNSTGIVNSGTCTGGVVDGTTGKATLTCDAIGTFADKTADTCFNELVTAPAPYTPTTKTLLGADDPNNECFRIQGSSGFFTGGGRVDVPGSVDSVVKTSGKGPTQKVTPTTFKLTHGFELHCDAASGPNNLEINWLQSQFHLEQLVTAECVDDGSTNEPPPSADTKTNGHGPTLDVYYGVGYGRYNGECGAKAEWVMDDNGEPGKADQIIALQITSAGGLKVLSINPSQLGVRDTSVSGTWKNPGDDSAFPWLNLVTGNHQFTPHQTGTHGPTQTNPCPAVAP